MAEYTQPTSDGKEYYMDWDDYVKHGFDEKKAKKRVNKIQKAAIKRVKKAVKDKEKE